MRRSALWVLRFMAITVFISYPDRGAAQHTALLESAQLRLVVADNEAFGPHHRAGYSGLAELSLRAEDANLFVPAYAGLNFEHIFSGDARSYGWNIFEPRQAPMELRRAGQRRVELHQARTEHWPLRSRVSYDVDGSAVDFTFCATPLDDAWAKHGYIGIFFASYIHQPEDMSLHFLGRARGSEEESSPQWIDHLPPRHGEAANHRPSGSGWDPPLDDGFKISLAQGHSPWEYTEPFYYGRAGRNVFIMMFGDPPPGGEIRFAQSPSGGGQGNPAWDFIFLQRDYEVGREFCFRGRAVYKPYVNEEEVIEIYEQWSGRPARRPEPQAPRIHSRPAARGRADEAVETLLAPASAEHPRQSEGDIAVLADGSLLVAWTDFYGGGRDDSPARISASRSSDGGRTWGPRFTLQDNVGQQNVMSVSFLRSNSGDLLFFYLLKNSRRDLDVMMRRSTDEGLTWGDSVLVTADEGYHVMNNDRVIQLASGRLLCPVASTSQVWTREENFRATMYMSDDDGLTWRRGVGWVSCPKRGAMEPGVLEMDDGRVLQIIRTQMGRIWHAYSEDQGETWTEAKPWTVAAPESPSTLVRLPESHAWLLIYNPNVQMDQGHLGPRTPLVAALSRDEGRTWSEPKMIESDSSATYAYVSVTFQGDRALLTYYVSENSHQRISLKYKSIPLAWLRE